MNIYIDLPGGIRHDLDGQRVSWTDKWGDHAGTVTAYRKTSETGGTEASRQRMVYEVTCDDGSVRELRPFELRDIITKEA